jgi:hypothetical protein
MREFREACHMTRRGISAQLTNKFKAGLTKLAPASQITESAGATRSDATQATDEITNIDTGRLLYWHYLIGIISRATQL